MECAKCGKEAKLQCSTCKESPMLDGEVVVRYCGEECQTADKAHHKATCNRIADRTFLHRVVVTAQKLWYIHREYNWCQLNVQSVESKGKVITLHGESFPDTKEFRVFPSDIVFSKKDRLALLSFLGCRDGVVWMLEFLAGFLSDIIEHIVEVELYPKNPKLHMTIVDDRVPFNLFPKRTRHHILKVTLRSKETYAIDIAGAQFGYPGPVIPWERYEERRVLSIIEITCSPRSAGLICTNDYSEETILRDLLKTNSPKPADRPILQHFIEVLSGLMLHWQADEKLSLVDMWRLPESTFRTKRDDLVDFLDWSFHRGGTRQFTVRGRALEAEIKRWEHCKV